jgi:methylenetetrahydrofolate reductase (NADPH)
MGEPMPANDDLDLSSPLNRRGAAASTSPLQVSFEFFPPTDPEMEATLSKSIRRLEPLAPRFVSVTCGADGSTRDRTVEVVRRIRAQSSLTVAPHVTSIGLSRDELRELARNYWGSGIRHLVALRGDAPAAASVDPLAPIEVRGGPGSTLGADVCRSGIEVVETVRSVAPFDISVAAYPEGHPEARSAREDLDHLKRKLDAGASRAITQFFYDNEAYLRLRDACAQSGIRAPIVPGILPIHRFRQVKRFARRCGASIPEWLENRFAGLDEDAETSRLLGAAVAVEQVEFLRRHGVSEFHFYTLNRAELTYAVCHALGVREAKVVPSANDAR